MHMRSIRPSSKHQRCGTAAIILVVYWGVIIGMKVCLEVLLQEDSFGFQNCTNRLIRLLLLLFSFLSESILGARTSTDSLLLSPCEPGVGRILSPLVGEVLIKPRPLLVDPSPPMYSLVPRLWILAREGMGRCCGDSGWGEREGLTMPESKGVVSEGLKENSGSAAGMERRLPSALPIDDVSKPP